MNTIIGHNVKQPQGFSAFIPDDFPPKSNELVTKILSDNKLLALHTRAVQLLGKLDGVTTLLPDKDCFLLMFVRKDATSSSQIEGTRATIMDVIEQTNIEHNGLPSDVDDIIHYITALNYGLERGKELPLSLRFIRELHKILMDKARVTQHATPGEFRTGQNWIGGTKPDNARFVPPPVHEMNRALGDLENFIHYNNTFLPLIKAGLMHAQFETIHPFNDGNGRTGRMLITMFLSMSGLLEMPILYLSSFFKKHQNLYYEKLNGYHNGKIAEWLNFFLDGIVQTAQSAIETCNKIFEIRERDRKKILALNKVASESTIKVLDKLYEIPIVGIADIISWTKLSKQGAYNLINRLESLGILYPRDENSNYGKKWLYQDYLAAFNTDDEM